MAAARLARQRRVFPLRVWGPGGVGLAAVRMKLPLIACSLSADGQKRRLSEWAELLGQASSGQEVEGGMRYVFPPFSELADRVRTLASAEQRCCPFLDFTVQDDADRVLMTVIGPPEGQDALHFVFAAAARR